MKLFVIATLFILVRSGLNAAPAPAGIPRELAIERARQVSDVRYHLSYELTPHADTTRAHEEVRFRSNSITPLWIDFREGTVSRALLNGATITATIENGHFLLSAPALRQGENTPLRQSRI